MRVDFYKDELEMGKAEAEHLVDIINSKEHPVICVPAGQSCICMFNELVKMYKEGKVDFDKVKFVGLDEWYDCKQYEGTARWILDTTFLNEINLNEDHCRFFNTNAEDPEKECQEVEKFIEDNGGLDYIALGVGMNGHVALNEPGVDLTLGAHVNTLAEKTKEVSEKYFENGMPDLKKGLTLGYKNIFEAREIVVFINGERKVPIFEKFMKTPVTNEFPVTNIKTSSKARMVVDLAASKNIYVE